MKIKIQNNMVYLQNITICKRSTYILYRYINNFIVLSQKKEKSIETSIYSFIILRFLNYIKRQVYITIPLFCVITLIPCNLAMIFLICT